MKAVVAAFNQEKALVGAFSVITNLRMELFEALVGVVARIFSPEYRFALGLLLEPEDEAGLVPAARPAGETGVARQRGAVS